MKVKTLGQKENPAIMMIPGMFCTSDMPEIAAEYLKDDFYMILPTLDGHHREEPVYHSKQDDGREIVSWLHENGIERLALLQGTSMGAEVALEVARQIDIPVHHYLFDGGPFFYFPKFIRSIMAGKFMKFGNLVRGKSKEEAAANIMKNKFVKKIGDGSQEFFREMLDSFIDIFQWIGNDSVRRIADTCYQCVLPEFDEERVRRFTFLYSENEPARKAEKKLRNKYPGAKYLVVKGFGHGGFQAEKPEEYAKLMRSKAISQQ